MNVTIDETRPGVVWAAGNAGVTPEAYVAARVADLQDSWDAALIESIKKENEPFFELAARLPLNRQDALRNYVQTVAREEGIIE